MVEKNTYHKKNAGIEKKIFFFPRREGGVVIDLDVTRYMITVYCWRHRHEMLCSWPLSVFFFRILVLIVIYLCFNWQLHCKFIYDLRRVDPCHVAAMLSENKDFVPEPRVHMYGNEVKVVGPSGLSMITFW